jgi:hypothetical protein
MAWCSDTGANFNFTDWLLHVNLFRLFEGM